MEAELQSDGDRQTINFLSKDYQLISVLSLSNLAHAFISASLPKVM